LATLDSNGISTSSKAKTPALTNGVEAYSKEILREEIRRLTTTNAQLVNDKLAIKAVKIKLEVNKAKLINEKNILVTKRKELWAELTEAVVTSIINIQTPVIIIHDKLKVKRPSLFDETKETFQRFFTKTRYYYRFYNQNLLFDLDKI